MYNDIQWYTVESRVPGGGLRISGDRDDRMGDKVKTQENPLLPSKPPKSHAEFPSHKNFQKALNDITRKIETQVLNIQKNPCLNQASQKILAKIFLPPKIGKSKISTPPPPSRKKNPSIIPVSWNPEYHGPWVPCFVLLCCFNKIDLNYREVWKIEDKITVFGFLGDRNQVWFELWKFRTRAREIGILL